MKLNAMTIGVIGAGQMGSGIAQVMAWPAMQQVLLFDANAAALQCAMAGIQTSLSKLASKGQLTEAEANAALARLKPVQTLEALAHAEVIIEAVPEIEALKCKIFSELDALADPETILASNTSSISITRLAAATNRPEQVVGMHFMNPVPLMKLVELIPGLQTAPQTSQRVSALAEAAGKTVVAARDMPGFIANRVLMPLLNEAFYALYEGIGSAEAIDTVMKLGMNHPMGPLQLADFIGLDTVLEILNVLHTGLGDPKYRPCPLLAQYVAAGWLGKKSGRGVYMY
ncbi:MAG: 3-hydroxyacyl-CoA dehydrogenase NAD-binding domain-containing protein [Vampirovibrionales bacterium]|nr:3-hydroxyacyl-CoA dehydrogenase NAD-binding domain-containing protein [Vampirovibrionales bacterium]